LVPLMPNWPGEGSFAEELKKEAGSEGTVGPVQTFFLPAKDRPWPEDRLAALAPVDTVIHLSRERIRANVYPAVNVLTSRSHLIRSKALGDEHATIAERVRQALAALWATACHSEAGDDAKML
jgi:F0F1-type ATP synthase beta subunit